MTASVVELPPRLSFLDERAKARATSAVRTFESHTSAELVVSVRKRADAYLDVDVTMAGLFALASLLFLLFFPIDFDVTFMPVDVLVAALLGFGFARLFPSLKRYVVPRKRREETVLRAAKVAFHDLGVTATKDRTGLLVYVAMLERVVAVVTDRGVTDEAKKATEEARRTLEQALAESDVRTFAETLESLGRRFAASMPRSADDVNELPDEIA